MVELVKEKLAKKIPTLVYVDCPSCHKRRLLKEQHDDGSVDEVSDETVVAVDGTTRPVDICGFCVVKFDKRDGYFVKRQAKEMLKAMKAAQAGESGEGSIEL